MSCCCLTFNIYKHCQPIAQELMRLCLIAYSGQMHMYYFLRTKSVGPDYYH